MTELGHTPTFVGALEDIHEPGRVDAMFDRIDDMKERVHNVTDAVQANCEHLQEKYKVDLYCARNWFINILVWRQTTSS